jgi:hypothetical protein
MLQSQLRRRVEVVGPSALHSEISSLNKFYHLSHSTSSLNKLKKKNITRRKSLKVGGLVLIGLQQEKKWLPCALLIDILKGNPYIYSSDYRLVFQRRTFKAAFYVCIV